MKATHEFSADFLKFVGTIVIASLIFIVGLQIYSDVEESFADNYCESVLGDSVSKTFENSVWAEFKGLDQGYVSCCNLYYENNTIKTKCRIFEYKRSVI